MPLLAAPALPLHTAGKYVAAAYIVFFAIILIYVAIMAARVSRIERELGELLERSAGPRARRAEVERQEIEAAISLPEESARV
jgi:hypothetical protein